MEWDSAERIWKFGSEVGERNFSKLDSIVSESIARNLSGSLPNLSQSPLVLDLGTHETRIGFACENDPRICIRTQVGRPRTKRPGDELDRVGDEMSAADLARMLLRSPFEKQILTNFSTLEKLLDYLFYNLGMEFPLISSPGRISHPILITECICNPNYCRRNLLDLLFNVYNASGVVFSIDSLLSWYYYSSTRENSLESCMVIDLGNEACTIFPVFKGRPIFSKASRIDVGGSHCKRFLQSLLSLKYPHHRLALSDFKIEALFNQFARFAYDFHELISLEDIETISILFDFDFEEKPSITPEEEQERRLRREKLAERMREVAKQKREEKLEELRALLESYESLISRKDSGEISAVDYLRDLKDGGFSDERDFIKTYKQLKKNLFGKLGKTDDSMHESVDRFDLLEVPDENLTPEQLKEKHRQKMIKGSLDARIKKKEEKEAQLAEERKWKEQQRSAFLTDPSRWLQETLDQRSAILSKREKRIQKKSELQNRRSSESKKRMQLLGQMGTGFQEAEGDAFGERDEDWDVYRKVSTNKDDEKDVESESEKQELDRIEQFISEFQPDFQFTSTQTVNSTSAVSEKEKLREFYQIKLGLERERVCEAIFQPSMIGVEQTGLAEAIQQVYARLSPEENMEISRQFFVTGGLAKIPGLDKRLTREISMILPYYSKFDLLVDTELHSSWLGGKQLANSDNFESLIITKESFNFNPEFFISHPLGNPYFPTPSSRRL